MCLSKMNRTFSLPISKFRRFPKRFPSKGISHVKRLKQRCSMSSIQVTSDDATQSHHLFLKSERDILDQYEEVLRLKSLLPPSDEPHPDPISIEEALGTFPRGCHSGLPNVTWHFTGKFAATPHRSGFKLSEFRKDDKATSKPLLAEFRVSVRRVMPMRYLILMHFSFPLVFLQTNLSASEVAMFTLCVWSVFTSCAGSNAITESQEITQLVQLIDGFSRALGPISDADLDVGLVSLLRGCLKQYFAVSFMGGELFQKQVLMAKGASSPSISCSEVSKVENLDDQTPSKQPVKELQGSQTSSSLDVSSDQDATAMALPPHDNLPPRMRGQKRAINSKKRIRKRQQKPAKEKKPGVKTGRKRCLQKTHPASAPGILQAMNASDGKTSRGQEKGQSGAKKKTSSSSSDSACNSQNGGTGACGGSGGDHPGGDNNGKKNPPRGEGESDNEDEDGDEEEDEDDEMEDGQLLSSSEDSQEPEERQDKQLLSSEEDSNEPEERQNEQLLSARKDNQGPEDVVIPLTDENMDCFHRFIHDRDKDGLPYPHSGFTLKPEENPVEKAPNPYLSGNTLSLAGGGTKQKPRSLDRPNWFSSPPMASLSGDRFQASSPTREDQPPQSLRGVEALVPAGIQMGELHHCQSPSAKQKDGGIAGSGHTSGVSDIDREYFSLMRENFLRAANLEEDPKKQLELYEEAFSLPLEDEDEAHDQEDDRG